jgi:hypothetical protein
MTPPLTASMGARFFAPRSTCAVCGREVGDDGAPVIAELDPEITSSASGLSLLVDVTPGERLVICRECAAK